MKNLKKLFSVLMVMAMVFTMVVSASAAEITEKGSILIKDNDTVLASKKTFAAYKVLNLQAYENNGTTTYTYSVPAELADFYAGRYGLDKTAADFGMKVASAIADEADIYEFAKDVLAAADGKIAAYTGKPVANGYQFSTLDLGYYVIEDTTAEGDYIKPVSALILDTVTPNVEVNVKAEKPPIEKKIDDDNNLNTDNDRVDANEAAIGDTITYVITSKVPDMTGYDKYFFIVNDTMSKGLTYTGNLVVKVGDKTLTADTDYFFTKVENADGTTSLKIVFNDFEQYNTNEFVGKEITITYTAELNQNAEINKIPNTNDVYLQYSNNPNEEYGGDDEPNEDDKQNKDPIGETPKDVVETYTTALEIVKTDPLGNRLTGAEFTLTGTTMNTVRVETETFTLDANGTYWKLKNGSYTTTDPESTIDGAPVNKENYESLTDKYTKTTNVTFETKEGETLTITGTVGEDGILRFEGLPAGQYTIKEIKAPDGYNILTETLNVTISWGENGFTYTGAVDANGTAQITVINQSGAELPDTGGMGTTIFYAVGGAMVLAAVVLLVTKRRMNMAE